MTTPQAATFTIAEVAQLLGAPPGIVLAILEDRPQRPSPLLLAGFPAPAKGTGARATWRRADVDRFAADGARLEAVRKAARQAFVGEAFRI